MRPTTTTTAPFPSSSGGENVMKTTASSLGDDDDKREENVDLFPVVTNKCEQPVDIPRLLMLVMRIIGTRISF